VEMRGLNRSIVCQYTSSNEEMNRKIVDVYIIPLHVAQKPEKISKQLLTTHRHMVGSSLMEIH
jgi:hypothetical protein